MQYRRTLLQGLAPLFALCLVVGLFVAACANPAHLAVDVVDQSIQDPSPAPGGALRLDFVPAARTIRPADEAAYTVVSYRVLGAGPGIASFDSGSLNTAVYTRNNLVAGEWSITVQGMNTHGHTISARTFALDIVSATTTSAVVALERAGDEGTLELTVVWDVAGEYDSIIGTFSPGGGEPRVVEFFIAEDLKSASYTGLLEPGNYIVSVSLSKHGIELDTIFEAAQVFDSYTSAASYAMAITLSYEYTTANPVFPVNFNDTALKKVRISGAAGKQLFLVKANVKPSAVAAASTGSSASVNELLPYTSGRVAMAASVEHFVNRVEWWEDPEVLAFNANPPPIVAGSAPRSLPGMEPSRSIVYGETTPHTVDVTTKTFWVQNASKAWIEIQATLRAMGTYSYIWVADANYDDTSGTIDDDNKLTTVQAQYLQTKFDGTAGNSFYDGLFRNVTNIFGYEYGGGDGGDGGRDGDQHISILVYDVDFDYSSSQAGGVFGYFWGKDFYTEQQLIERGWTSKTNLAEIFYIDAHFTDNYTDAMVSTLAHEFQHMIHFNEKFVQHGQNSATWYNEMCSMVCEDLVLENIGLDPVTDGAQGRLPTFMYSYAESGIKDWVTSTWPSSMKSYASAFAFGAYLARNYGGATFFQNLLSNNLTNEASITAALAEGGYPDTFEDAFRYYGEAMVFDDQPPNSTVKTFKQAVTTELSDISYTAMAIDLFDIDTFWQYNQDTGSWVESAGFRTYAPEEAVELRPFGNSIHTQTSWTNITNNVDFEITLTEPSEPAVEYFLMVK